jgi:CubicO group peptidase (beta-lactamase class C family)
VFIRHVTALLAAAMLQGMALAVAMPSNVEIRRMLATRVERQKWATGIVVGLVTPKGRHVVAYGTTTRKGDRKVDGNTAYDIGSVTKVFTAVALADMALRREIALDDPVLKCLPSGTVLPHDGARQITFADLATHTAGLPLRPENLAPKDPENKYAGYSEADLYRFLATYKAEHAIGGTYDYSNVGYGLLGVALSRCMGKSYDDLIQSRVLKPLGMTATSRALKPRATEAVAAGYAYDVGMADLIPAEHWDYGSGVAGAGGYRSTASDMMKLLDAILGYRPSPLAPALTAMTKARRPGGMQPATAIALAWNILDQDGREIVWKNGSVGGFRAFLGYDRAAGIGVVALANAQTESGADDIGLHILDPQIPVDVHIPRKHTPMAINGALLERYLGVYKYSDTDIMTVSRRGDHLLVSEAGQELEFFPESQRDFFSKFVDVQITFEIGAGRKATAAVWHQGGQAERGGRVK